MSSAEPPPSTPEHWEQTLAQLRATNAELQRRRADAEKDRELFRDLYGRASAHASAVSAENDALGERAARAEGQARDGVAMVRAMYEERVRALERELARWKGQWSVLVERDGRMDDELRRRAALEPELRAENRQLRERLEALEEDYRRLEGLLEGMTKQQVGEETELETTVKDPALVIS